MATLGCGLLTRSLWGPGNPLGGKVSKLRAALVQAVTEEDIRAIAGRLVEDAREGDLGATRELLLRTLGRPIEADLLDKLERLEAVLAVEGKR